VALPAFEALAIGTSQHPRQKGAAVDIRVSGPDIEGGTRILGPEALDFVAALQHEFGARRDTLLAARRARRAEVSRTGRLDFLEETAHVRESEWQVAPAPVDLRDRRVEMTGPTDRKMAINALNSGAQVWLADLEDASTPHWRNVVSGQVNLFDAIRGDISFTSPAGKEYAVRRGEGLPAIVVRPRGWHLDEKHLTVDGAPVVGAFVDFGLYFFHNAQELLKRGSGPYFYLPKTESHLEARLWNDVFIFAQQRLGIDRARSGRLCWSRPSRQPSRCRRSSTSCATTPPDSTPGAGTTCSASSSTFATPALRSSCPTARPSA